MEVFKDNILDGIIYTFHFQNFPAVAAHLMLTQMIRSEACTLQYVQGLYKRIEERKFSLKKPHLLDFPDHVLENVVKELDVESRAVVRKTCKKLRSLVDNHPRRLKRLYVHIDVAQQSVALHSDGLHVYYNQKKGGCLVELSHPFRATKSVKRSKFIEGEMKQLATQDLKTILINPKLEIEFFGLYTKMGCGFYPKFKELVEMLPTLHHKLHIEDFLWQVNFSTDDLVKIFESMKPGTLKIIQSDTHRRSTCSHLKTKIFKLPQWREAKTLDCKCLMKWKNCIHLTHFQKVILNKNSLSDRRDEITGEIIMAMKDKLLENKNLNQIIMHDNHGYNPVKKLRDTLRPFQSHSDPRWAEFNYPNSNKKLWIRVYEDTIWFKGPRFRRDIEIERMVDDEDYSWLDSPDESEEDMNDEEETSEEETDVEDPATDEDED
ncbi:unnamed protein product [Caenorhabditis brenneri]